MNSEIMQNRSTLQPKKGHQRDLQPYTGQLHPQTKKRHGKGTYHYKNKFFSYEGEYIQGKKHSFGVLKMKDGTLIQANFFDDEIQGQGKITYPDGAFYQGDLLLGQKHGKGLFESIFEKYEGEWRQNSKQGQGKHQIKSTGQTYEGCFKDNKLQGQGSLRAYNYFYQGEWNQGRKQGYGQQINLWRRAQQQTTTQQKPLQQKNPYQKQKNYDSYEYKGQFASNQFKGQGKYSSKTSNYVYEGQFIDGLPKNYPNEFRVFVSSNVKNQNGQEKQGEKILLQQALQYELQVESKNIYVQCVYQGPQYLDENQPTQEEIQQLIKNWQNQNKKNKNPPPMPDFRTPKMKKPELILIQQQNFRQILFSIQKQGAENSGSKMKIDYRNDIAQKRAEFQKLKEQMKKNQEEDPKKKGGKKEAKNENEFKINIFKENPSKKEKFLKLQTSNGTCCFERFELPDDFPQGKYILTIQSSFKDFGQLKSRKIQLNVKPRQAVGKKK